MRKLGTAMEFALVLAFGATLAVRAVGSPFDPPAPPAPLPSFEQIEAAVVGAEARAAEVNGRR
ncbi:MAG TPA: hypothetical protein VF702_07600 [Allosphingosinicella sp.]|jgi:hypothetical protein